MPPARTGFGDAPLVIRRSAPGLTVVVTVAVLLVGSGSPSVPVALAVLLSAPATWGLTLIVIVALAPLASERPDGAGHRGRGKRAAAHGRARRLVDDAARQRVADADPGRGRWPEVGYHEGVGQDAAGQDRVRRRALGDPQVRAGVDGRRERSGCCWSDRGRPRCRWRWPCCSALRRPGA